MDLEMRLFEVVLSSVLLASSGDFDLGGGEKLSVWIGDRHAKMDERGD